MLKISNFERLIAMEDFNKNDKQIYFAQIKGSLFEANVGDRFCNITLAVGHENSRDVNLIMKRSDYDKFITDSSVNMGDRLLCQYYLSSKKKNDRWYTNATVLSIVKN